MGESHTEEGRIGSQAGRKDLAISPLSAERKDRGYSRTPSMDPVRKVQRARRRKGEICINYCT